MAPKGFQLFLELHTITLNLKLISMPRSIKKSYTYDGRTLTLKEWAEEVGLTPNTLNSRLYTLGWDFETALTRPTIKTYPVNLETNTKVCSVCNIEKSVEDFPLKNRKTRKDKTNLHSQCKECNKLRFKIARQRLKDSLIEYYSNGEFKCALCPETRMQLLEIDHINGDGAEDRRQLIEDSGAKWSGLHFYQRLKRQGFPEGFRVLCRSCNYLEYLRIYGITRLTDEEISEFEGRILGHYRGEGHKNRILKGYPVDE